MNPGDAGKRRRTRGWLLAAALVGAVAAIAVLGGGGSIREPLSIQSSTSESLAPPPTQPARETVSRAEQLRTDPLRRRIASLEQELRLARKAAARNEKPVMLAPEPPSQKPDESVPPPIPFPPDVPKAYTPQGFQNVALEAARSCGLHLDVFAIDCSEFPCISWTRALDPTVRTFSMDACAPWTDAFSGAIVIGSFSANDDRSQEERYLAWMPVPPDKAMLSTVFRRGQERARGMIDALRPQ
jgi:hypothetical protein